uniref:CRAL/TRIO N-terminal domain-containing protein n=1 Tax=Cacopsylla melanoneura TaxID=428564 RepID=A0A8D8TBQ5_9HEMI
MSCPLIHFTKNQIEEFKKEKGAPADEIVNEYVVELQKWLAQQPHLPKNIIDESMMRKYLFGCKYNQEEVKMRLTNYFVLRARFPRLYGNRDPCIEEHRKNRSALHTAFMPQATKEGYRIQLSIISDPDPELYVPEDLIKHSHACSDLLLRDEQEISTPGIILIISGINFTVNHIAKWDLSLLKASTGILTVSSVSPV